MVATCFIAVVTIVTVEAVSGLLVTASTARTVFAEVASVRADWVATSSDVTPESTVWRGNAGQMYLWSYPRLDALLRALAMLSTLPDQVTARSSSATLNGTVAVSPGQPAALNSSI